MLADKQRSPEQVAVLRRMTPEQKWNIVEQMYWRGRSGKKAALLREHPDWSENQAEQEVRRILLSDRLDLIEPVAPPLEEFLRPFIDGTKNL
jgi:hypothetical protein